ncbi:MAG: cellulase family glycosylhydrolase [Deltaproteobacteria bacterium]|nr:cellulase family glycosylhydrolase [Deltaproteobacteria bacterium]
MRSRVLRAVMLLAVGCSTSEGRKPFSPLDSDGTHFRDLEGRVVLFRGINARVAGVFDVTFADGRKALEPIPELQNWDFERMRQLGFNLLRLPIQWSGVEPRKDEFDEAYLLQVDRVINDAASAGLFVLVDLHQDAYSKEIGEDGAPLWAIHPPPTTLLEGPLTDLGERRLSAEVLAAFESFFDPDDPHGLQEQYFEMLEHVGRRYADHPAVVGIEIFNEPQTSESKLFRFHARAAARLREAAPSKLIFFEPTAVRNITDSVTPSEEPFPITGAVYSPHVYTLVLQGGDLKSFTIEDLRPSVESARLEAASWKTPLFIGEFGAGPATPSVAKYLGIEQDLQDEFLASSAFWLWKEESQGSWGLFDRVGTGWAERQEMVEILSRPRAERIAGTPESVRLSSGQLAVRYRQAIHSPNVLYVPPRMTTKKVTCDGKTVTPAMQDGRLLVTCAGNGVHEVVIDLE